MAKRDISERHEIRVEGEKATFVFVADSEDGKLVIKQIRKGGREQDVCALTLSDPRELEDFFEGLQRVLHATETPKSSGALAAEGRRGVGGAGRRIAPAAASAQSPRVGRASSRRGSEPQGTLPLGASGPLGADDAEREQIIERARTRNPKAFEPWSPEEEEEIRTRFRAGRQLEDIARAVRRSPRAVLMRLKRLGEDVEGVAPMLQ